MNMPPYFSKTVLVAGDSKPAISLCLCLLRGGYNVTLLHPLPAAARAAFDEYLALLQEVSPGAIILPTLTIISTVEPGGNYGLAIAITKEDLAEKQRMIRLLEAALPPTAPIAINME